MLGPDFFIVGAPKCGTTFLDTHLAAHPEIFMAKKEQHFFGSDLGDVWDQPTSDAYFASFAGSKGANRRGEGSGWYLWSRRAAEEIHAYDPAARIIAMLRDPVDMLPSLHSQYRYDGLEDIEDFGAALAAEDERRSAGDDRRLYYREVARFAEQLERYLAVFGHDQVHVVLFDDLVTDPVDTYRRVLAFLDVDQQFTPDLQPLNPNKQIRSGRAREWIRRMADPSSRIRRFGVRAIPIQSLRTRMLDLLPVFERLNKRVVSRAPIDPAIRAGLAEDLRPGVLALGELIGRDLNHWCTARDPEFATPPEVTSPSPAPG